MYSFICYYKKEKEVCSKYFLFKEFCRFSQTACQKNVLMITKKSYGSIERLLLIAFEVPET